MSINRLYQNLREYYDDIFLLSKDYMVDYLNQLEENGEKASAKQHIFQETLLRKEIKSLLIRTDSNTEDFEEELLENAEKSMKAGLFLPLEYLCRIFRLNKFERFCVTLLTAFELYPDMEKFNIFINNDFRGNAMTIETAVDIYCRTNAFYGDYLFYFSSESKLTRHFFNITENIYLLKREICLKPVIKAFLFEDNSCSNTNNYVTCYFPEDNLRPVLSAEKIYLPMLEYVKKLEQDKIVLFYLYGRKGTGKKLNIMHFAQKLNKPVYFMQIEKVDESGENLKSLLQTVVTEVIIKQGILCICSISQVQEDEKTRKNIISRVLDYINPEFRFLFFTSDCPKKTMLHFENVNVISIEMPSASMTDNHHFFTELGKGYYFDSDVNLDELADRFFLTPGQIAVVYEEAWKQAQWNGQSRISLKLLQKVLYENLEHDLGKKASKVKKTYRWKDLILPVYQINMLKAACDQIKYKYKVFSEWGYGEKMAYGTGLSMIFSGSPGTGKTMAAQIIAGELGLELYKIELACVVSKYIGETERNLNEIFTEAMKSQAIIFFDEADILFCKRSEVKDSNDKYSNMEAAFMLQKIEEYTGIVILATNYVQNVDEAFKRRIKFLIEFPFPDSICRKMLWQNSFPEKLPLKKDVDFDFLAERFELSGSNIRNVALNAAFLAASENDGVGMRHIIKAVMNEFIKSGKKLTREELGEYQILL